ncbi:MAG: Fic family protein [Desulfobacterales bacterium]|nr:Fic family protein [Desulfobacterales bacterium]
MVSSQIEGTQSSLSDLLLFEIAAAPGVPFEDVVEVSNHVAALEHGLARIKEGFPLSNRLIRDMHEILMRRGRGSEKQPGEFRTIQNWLGGADAGRRDFRSTTCGPRAGLHGGARADSCTTSQTRRQPSSRRRSRTRSSRRSHPFLDGNGRVGRLLATPHPARRWRARTAIAVSQFVFQAAA